MNIILEHPSIFIFYDAVQCSNMRKYLCFTTDIDEVDSFGRSKYAKGIFRQRKVALGPKSNSSFVIYPSFNSIDLVFDFGQ